MPAISSITKAPYLVFNLFFLSHFFACHGDDVASKCPNEFTAYESCVGGTATTECLDCVARYWPATITHCTDIDYEICTGLTSCSACAGCEVEFFALLQCTFECDSLNWSDCLGDSTGIATNNEYEGNESSGMVVAA